MKTLYRKLTRKRRLKRNLIKALNYLPNLSVDRGLCQCVTDIWVEGLISQQDRNELRNLMYDNRPNKHLHSGNYWWKQTLEGRIQRIEFLNKLINDLHKPN